MNVFRNSLLGLAFALTTTVAYAAPVSYSTSGDFPSGAGNSITVGNATITFTGTAADVNTPVGNSFGVFTLTIPEGVSAELFDNVEFSLTFDQTVPTVGSETVPGVVNGSFDFDSGIVRYIPGAPSVNIGNVTYTFDNPSYVLQVPTGNNGGVTTIQGTISGGQGDVIPEPTTYALLGSGLSALVYLSRRRRAV
jgi:hypothetical protein